MHLVNSKYNEPLLQTIIQQCSLTEVEAKCIIVYTMESIVFRNLSSCTSCSVKRTDSATRRPWKLLLIFRTIFGMHCRNYRISRCPCTEVLTRGWQTSMTFTMRGNVVHWHYPSSCTTDKAVASKFSNGGTLLSLINVTKAKSIQAFSLIPSEREYLIDHTSTFDVTISLSCEGAKALKQFSSDLPANVDLVVLTARAHALSHGFTPCAGVSSTASVFAPEPASAPV